MNKKYLIPLVLVLMALFYHLLTFNNGINLLDEGLLLHGTERMIQGETPYKDFPTLYPPGSYLTLSLFFKLFGYSILTYKIMKLFFLLITIPVVYFLSKKIIKNRIFSIFPSLLLIFYSPSPPYARLFFALLSFLLLFILYKRRSKLWTFIPGLLIGLSILFSHEIGLSAFIASFIFIILSQTIILFNFKKFFREFILLSFGTLIPVSFFLIYLYSKSALFDAFYYSFYYPIKVFPLYFALPYPSILNGLPNILLWIFRKGLVFYIPILIYLGIIIFLIFRIKKYKKVSKRLNQILLITVFGLLIFRSVFVRSDLSHLFFALIPVYILGMFLLEYLYNFKKILILLLILPLIFVLQSPAYQFAYQPYEDYVLLDLPKAQIYEEETKAEAIKEVVEYIQDKTEEDDYILVVPYEAAFYFLTERNNPTPFTVFLPGYPEKETQEEFIETLKDAKYVIYGHGWKVDGKDFKDYARTIHNYITKNYKLEKKISHYEILRKK